jgi:hypothetical protein
MSLHVDLLDAEHESRIATGNKVHIVDVHGFRLDDFSARRDMY